MHDVPTFDAFPTETWEILSPLGSGGQSHSVLARHVPSGELAALKRLHAQHATDLKQLELFFREGAVLRTLDHPGIPRVLDTFLVREGDAPADLYIAQSYFDGEDLQVRMRKGQRPSVADVQRWLEELLDILAYLHGRVPPVIHRDIKPSNIIVRPDGGIALVDFGAVASGFATDSATTIVGTPGYSAPEQFAGAISQRTDLYALGVVIWHVLTGRVPVVDPETGQLPLPPDLPPSLRAFIEGTTQPSPRARPADVAAARALLAAPPPPQVPSVPAALTGSIEPTDWRAPLPPAPRDPRGPHASIFKRLAKQDAEENGGFEYFLLLFVAVASAAAGLVVMTVNMGAAHVTEANVLFALAGLSFISMFSASRRRLKYFEEDPTRGKWSKLFVTGTVLPARVVAYGVRMDVLLRTRRVEITLSFYRPGASRPTRAEYSLVEREAPALSVGGLASVLVDPDKPDVHHLLN